MQRVGCPGEVLMCKVLYAGKGEGRLLVYDHRSCILPGASSSHVPNLIKENLRFLFLSVVENKLQNNKDVCLPGISLGNGSLMIH